MKHIKLFEGFDSSENPVIQATGDWSRLTMEGTPLDWVHPDRLSITYYTNPTPEMIKEASLYGKYSPDDCVDEIMGGDQNGGYLTQRNGMVTFLADSSYSPKDYENALQQSVKEFNINPRGFEEDMCQLLLEDPELELTPEFLSHCKAVVADSKTSQAYIKNYPQYYSKHPEIFPGGDRSKISIMKPRVILDFKVV